VQYQLQQQQQTHRQQLTDAPGRSGTGRRIADPIHFGGMLLAIRPLEHSNTRFESILFDSLCEFRYANRFKSIRFVKKIGLSIH